MNLVEPIRSEKKIDAMKAYLRGKSLRDHTLFVVGINVALRISDLLKWTWEDVLSSNSKSFDSIKLKEGKTGKEEKYKTKQDVSKGPQRAFR